MIIDVHAHIGHSDVPTASDLQKGCTAELVLKYADQAQIDKTVVFPTTYLDYTVGNQLIADAVAQYPDRLIGFARADVKHPNAVASFVQAVEELGLKGLKLVPRGPDLENPVLFELFEKCADYDIPVILCTATIVEATLKWAGDFRRVNFIMGHMGAYIACDDHRKYIQAAQKMANVYLEPSTVLTQVTLREAGQKVPHRVVFGSDSPALSPKAEMEKLKAMEFPADAERKIFGENAKELLKL